jgi:hypothetical protein
MSCVRCYVNPWLARWIHKAAHGGFRTGLSPVAADSRADSARYLLAKNTCIPDCDLMLRKNPCGCWSRKRLATEAREGSPRHSRILRVVFGG